MAESLVSPLNPAAVPPQPAQVAPAPGAGPPAPADQDNDGIPDEVLQIPAMQALMAGAPPAVSARIEEYNKRPEGKMIAQAAQPLQAAGVGFYKSLSGEYGVLFNSLKINPQDIKAADKAGRLLEIAPSMDQVNQEVAASGLNNPVLSAGAPGGAPQAASGAVPPSGSQMTPPPAPASPAPSGAQDALLQAARLKAMAPGAPTSGPAPGAGRILNQVMKPVV